MEVHSSGPWGNAMVATSIFNLYGLNNHDLVYYFIAIHQCFWIWLLES